MSETKKRAVMLLRKYDKMRRETREVERELHETVAAYGREVGIYGLSKDHFRNMLAHERATKEEGVRA